ncbi:MAG: DUF2179 domain-containing protein [bacterium]
MEIMPNFVVDYLLLPLFIFLARICDVSLGTIRIVFVSKGLKFIAPILGFIEVLIWIVAISRIMENLTNWACYIAYAGGFVIGNYIGMIIEEKIAIGVEMIRIITKKNPGKLISELKEKGYGVTFIKAEGNYGEVGVIYSIIKRNKLDEVVSIIRQFNPKALYTVEDIKFVNKNILNYLC